MVSYKASLLKLFYALTLLFLTIYSYSQIDLNLTLSSNPLYQNFQKQLIYLGYYNRPISVFIFAFILFLLFINYYLIYQFIKKQLMTMNDLIHLIIITVLILLFSYPAFSYDIFNYIFDARILVKYGLNPYQFKALDFPADHWIRFMHWTHRTYPYGPVWIILTMIPYILGIGKFVLTLINFRIFFIATYLINIYLLNKILKALRFTTNNRLLNLVLFAFNPLIIIETLVSPHNESLMLSGILLAIYYYVGQKSKSSYTSLLLSGGIKFLSWVAVPIFFIARRQKWQLGKFMKWVFYTQLIILVPVIYLREIYPWYFITIIGLGALIGNSKLISYLILGFSLGPLLRYLPFIFFGDYNSGTQIWQLYLTFLPFLALGIIYLRDKIKLT